MMSEFHKINYDNYNINNLLVIYQKKKQEIIDNIMHNPQELVDHIFTTVLPYDQGCIHEKQACVHCKILTRYKNNQKDDYFIIDYGKLIGTRVSIKTHSIFHAWLKLNKNVLIGDQFTIGLIMRCLYENVVQNEHLLIGFYCKNIGTILTRTYTLGNFTDLINNRDTYAKNLLLQLVIILKKLKSIGFTIGQATVNNLFFDKEPISYDYQGYHVKSNFTLDLDNFEQSVIALPTGSDSNKKLYITSLLTLENPTLIRRSFVTTTCDGEINICNEEIVTYVKNKNSNRDIDIYSFILSLMKEETFRQQIMANEKLLHLWRSMWLIEQIPNEINIINGEIKNILYDKWLRVDILDHMWSLLTTM